MSSLWHKWPTKLQTQQTRRVLTLLTLSPNRGESPLLRCHNKACTSWLKMCLNCDISTAYADFEYLFFAKLLCIVILKFIGAALRRRVFAMFVFLNVYVLQHKKMCLHWTINDYLILTLSLSLYSSSCWLLFILYWPSISSWHLLAFCIFHWYLI